MTADDQDVMQMTDEEIKRRQRGRNIAVALAVVALGVMVFAVTVVRLKAGIEASMGG